VIGRRARVATTARIIHHPRGASLAIRCHSAFASLTNTESIRSVVKNTEIANSFTIHPLSGELSRIVAFILLLTAGFQSGCSRSESAARSTLRVFAVSSLTEAFRDIERDFEADHPNVDVELSFAVSQLLRLQLEQGASADLFASANQKHMEALVKARLVSRGEVLARKRPDVRPSSPVERTHHRGEPRSHNPFGYSARMVVYKKQIKSYPRGGNRG